MLVQNHLCGVIEVDPSGSIRQQISKSILGRVVDPLFDVDSMNPMKVVAVVVLSCIRFEIVVEELRV